MYQIYGPHQKVNRIIPLAITQLQENLTFNSTSGLQIRDFLYVDDLTNLIIKIIKKKNKTYGIFNVGSGQPITIKKILNKIIEINGGTVFFGKEKMRKDETKILYPSINKIKKYYNWEPKIEILKGLKKQSNIMKNKPIVSIIMNCFNGERYLSKSLKSLKEQKFKNWELIFGITVQQIKVKKFFFRIKIKDLNILRVKDF